MKMYVAQDGFRMVGKAWEIRNKLKEITHPNNKTEEPLISLLSKRTGATSRKIM
ncbi:MAG: Z-ring formation inhibitor MciZ [Gorillibacterium sp.]|nr:Z-ring formation inhibitor MciZ [Gorillibacterium sp.]